MHKYLTALAFSATSLVVVGVLVFLFPEALPMGGSPGSLRIEAHEDLAFLRQKEEILQSHFESLRAEESRNAREMAAVSRVLEQVSLKAQDAIGRRVPSFESYRQALEQRLQRLSAVSRDLREARATLTAIVQDREKLEGMIRDQYASVAHSPRPAAQKKYGKAKPGDFALLWPVYPLEGISAAFKDRSYRKRFGFEHYAIDIPEEQRALVRAPMDGIVAMVNDMGYGYNTLKILHGEELETVYGHVNTFLVHEGEEVKKGQAIATVGGRPGTKGAGFYTTGSHLHFETRLDGEAMDPLEFLPQVEVTL